MEYEDPSDWSVIVMTDQRKDDSIQYIKTDDGVDIPVRIFGTEGDKPPLVMLHGIQSHSGWFLESARFIASLGHPVYSFDRRGSGMSKERHGHVARFETLVDEAYAVVETAMKRHHGQRVHLLGHCFGAIPMTYLACRYPDMVESLIYSTPGILTRAFFSPAGNLRIALWQTIDPTHNITLILPPEDMADLDDGRRMIREDSLALHEMTAKLLFECFWARVHLRKRMRQLTLPLFVALAANDRVTNNQRTTALFDTVPSAIKKVKVYEKATHLLEFSEAKDAFFGDLADWLGGGYRHNP